MVIPKEREKREGLIGTILFHVLLIAFFLYYGLTYTVPMPETGLTVNLGTTDMGSGEVQPDVTGEEADPQPDPVEEVVPVTDDAQPQDASQDVVTQDNVETIEAPKPKTPQEIAAEKAAAEEAKKAKEQEAFKKKMAQASDALNNPNAQSGGGEGPDDQPGDKGQTDGSKNGDSYSGGGEGEGNYSLGGRAALSKPKPDPDCQEVGIVVIEVKVDRNGIVTYANIGRGTKNFADCLTSKALEAAKKTKWQPKNDAPVIQKGKIIYDFRVE